MFYAALILGMIFLGMLYLSYQWEEKQYEGIDHVMEDESGDVARDDADDKEAGQLWKGEIRGTEVVLSRGWQNEIYVEIEVPLSLKARIEYANPLRRVTRFFEELFSPRMSVRGDGEAAGLIAYTEEIEPVQRILSEWSNPDTLQVLKRIHHVKINENGFTAQFFQPDFDLDQLTARAKGVLTLYEAIPESLHEPVTNHPSDQSTPAESVSQE